MLFHIIDWVTKNCILGTCSFICHVSYIDQETAKGLFRSLIQAVTYYYQYNCSRVEANTLSVLSMDATNLPTYLHTILLMLNVKQGGSEYQLLSVWSDSTRESNLGLSTTKRTLRCSNQ